MKFQLVNESVLIQCLNIEQVLWLTFLCLVLRHWQVVHEGPGRRTRIGKFNPLI